MSELKTLDDFTKQGWEVLYHFIPTGKEDTFNPPVESVLVRYKQINHRAYKDDVFLFSSIDSEKTFVGPQHLDSFNPLIAHLLQKKNNEGQKLTGKILKSKGFKKEVVNKGEEDEYTWWYRTGVFIHEEYGGKFMLATSTREDGSLKSGYTIKTDNQLSNLVYALTSEKI